MASQQLLMDIRFIKSVLPPHYIVKESRRSGSVHCISHKGIDDRYDQEWTEFLGKIKKHFGTRFQEVHHNVCANHLDFTIHLKRQRIAPRFV